MAKFNSHELFLIGHCTYRDGLAQEARGSNYMAHMAYRLAVKAFELSKANAAAQWHGEAEEAMNRMKEALDKELSEG